VASDKVFPRDGAAPPLPPPLDLTFFGKLRTYIGEAEGRWRIWKHCGDGETEERGSIDFVGNVLEIRIDESLMFNTWAYSFPKFVMFHDLKERERENHGVCCGVFIRRRCGQSV
jgi:hypothetical protein